MSMVSLPPYSLREIAVVIPAGRLEAGLPPMIAALHAAGFGAIVVIDDGIAREDQKLFDSLSQWPKVHLLRHGANRGKGRALKTGIQFVCTSLTGIAGLVTADADGQHAMEDIVHVASTLRDAPGCVVLGCRRFYPGIPLRNRFGNQLTRLVFHFISGRDVNDTQTGLRGFPAPLLSEILALPGERYEYEMNVLAHLSHRGVQLIEVPIQTIYDEGNRSSHFRPVLDSMRIYFVLLRFYASSVISAARRRRSQ